MIAFDNLWQTAVLHKGGEKAVKADLPKVSTKKALCAQSDAYYLSEMSRRIFRAGLKHSVIDAKWPAFEAALNQFNPLACALMPDEKLDELMGNKALIRHLGKMKAIRVNAAMVLDIAKTHGSFGQFIAGWPEDDIVNLWAYLKKHGAQLGGMSGARFLRMVGKDTFLLTDDVVAVLKAHGAITKAPTSKKDLAIVQTVFNDWHRETGLPYSHISRVVSMTAGLW